MMSAKVKGAFLIGALLLLGSSVSAQTSPKPCESLTQSKVWQKAHRGLQEEFQRLFKPDAQKQILSFEKGPVLGAIISNSDFDPLFKARYWMSSSLENAKGMMPALIGLLTESKLVGLTNSADVIISERIASKDLKFYGHGWVIGDDLFQVSGRASWLLKEITGEDFGYVKPNSSASDLKRLQAQWADWYGRVGCR